MCEGYGSHSLCVCLSVIVLAATYFVYKSQVRCYKVPCGISMLCIVWSSLKTLVSPVLESFAYNRCLPHSLDRMNSTELFRRYKGCSFSDSFYKTAADIIFREKLFFFYFSPS